MADRFQKLFSLENNLYIENAPIILSAGALLKDSKSGSVVVQLKFKSISKKNIKGVKISLIAYDVSGKEIKGVDDYQYLDLNIPNGQSFASSKAIIMPEMTTRSFDIKTITVIFEDSSLWEIATPTFIVIPDAKPLYSELENEELVKQYRIATTTTKAKCIPNVFLNLWTCCCGEVNGKEYCTNCGINKNDAFSKYNIPDLTDAMNLRLDKEKEEQLKLERQAEIYRIEKENRRRKNKKVCIYTMLSMALLAIMTMVVIAVYINTESYIYNLSNNSTGFTINNFRDDCPQNLIIPDYIKGKPVTEIGDSAFEKLHTGREIKVKTMTIPSTITKIGQSAFRGCKELEEITLPSSCVKIESWALWDCNNLKTINYNGTLEEWQNIKFGQNWAPNCKYEVFVLLDNKRIALSSIDKYNDNDKNSNNTSNDNGSNQVVNVITSDPIELFKNISGKESFSGFSNKFGKPSNEMTSHGPIINGTRTKSVSVKYDNAAKLNGYMGDLWIRFTDGEEGKDRLKEIYWYHTDTATANEYNELKNYISNHLGKPTDTKDYGDRKETIWGKYSLTYSELHYNNINEYSISFKKTFQ